MDQALNEYFKSEEDLSEIIDRKILYTKDLSGEDIIITDIFIVKDFSEYEEVLEKLKLIGTETGENYFLRANLDIHIRVPIFMVGSKEVRIIYPKLEDLIENRQDISDIKRKVLENKLIEYSEGIVGLPNNWDGDGSVAITRESWVFVEDLLKKILYKLWEQAYNVPIPLVLPNSDGSFDIDWQTENFELLLNIPNNKKDLVHIYGEKGDSPENEIEVRINYDLVQGVIIEWLKKIL
ncbi:hypothetical protein LCGC14_1914050 [marine sediment metagenome]|uniref:Uncharacterized protein n=1 Tax=marine sediment metagenome TaxID=412755 RepID=A0A0F9I6S3_9ZZZZ